MSDRLQHALERAKELAAVPKKWLYFIQCQDFVKIGYATDVKLRFHAYQVHNPFKIKLLAAFSTHRPKAEEELLHTAFEAYRARGEWFKLPKTMIAWIRANRKSLTTQAVVDQLVATIAE